MKIYRLILLILLMILVFFQGDGGYDPWQPILEELEAEGYFEQEDEIEYPYPAPETAMPTHKPKKAKPTAGDPYPYQPPSDYSHETAIPRVIPPLPTPAPTMDVSDE